MYSSRCLIETHQASVVYGDDDKGENERNIPRHVLHPSKERRHWWLHDTLRRLRRRGIQSWSWWFWSLPLDRGLAQMCAKQGNQKICTEPPADDDRLLRREGIMFIVKLHSRGENATVTAYLLGFPHIHRQNGTIAMDHIYLPLLFSDQMTPQVGYP